VAGSRLTRSLPATFTVLPGFVRWAAAWNITIFPIAGYLSLLTLITIVTTWFAPETGDRDLDDPLGA